MGIPRFYGEFLKNHFPQPSKVLVTEIPADISSLSIDLNSLFHDVAQKVYGYENGKDPTRNERLKNTPLKQLEIEYFNEIGLKIIELVTQINPRDVLVLAVDGVAPMSKIIHQRQRRYKSLERKPNPFFDSNGITPGTDMMTRLDVFLKDWIVKSSVSLPNKVIYSSHMVPGEGEHKIMDYMKDGSLSVYNGAHIVYGMDADLVVLSMLAPIERIFLVRQEIQDVISIQHLREAIKDEMKTQTAIQDFAILTLFVGCDFLPTSPCFDNLNDSLNFMIKMYEKVQINLTDGKNIIWQNFSSFIKLIADAESMLLEKDSHKTRKNGYIMMDQSFKNGVFNYATFRSIWYHNELEFKGDNDFIEFTLTNKQIIKMCFEYIKGIYWTFTYYSKGNSSSDQTWFYPYHHSPLIKDCFEIINQHFVKKGAPIMNHVIPLSPVYQLICCIPPHSFNVLPRELRENFIEKTVCLNDLFPKAFEVELDGKNALWQGIALIPNPELDRIIYSFDKWSYSAKLLSILSPQKHFIYSRKESNVIINDFVKEQIDDRVLKWRSMSNLM
jgi:5'-3' exonuclease